MLRKIDKNYYDKYIDFAYQLACDLSHASFPVYTDGVKTEEDFKRISQRGLDRDNEEIFLFEHNETVEGWVHYYYIEDDKYIGVANLLVREGCKEALGELLEYWKKKLPGYTWCMYFPEENHEALSFMKKCNYQDKEQEVVDVLFFDDYSPVPEDGCVIQIDLGNFDMFREIHSHVEDNMYWTSDRIAATIDDWEIFAYIKNDQCQGGLYHNGKGQENLEIFGVDTPNDKQNMTVIKNLLIRCLNKAKANGAKSMYFFHNEFISEITSQLSFKRITVAHYFEEQNN